MNKICLLLALFFPWSSPATAQGILQIGQPFTNDQGLDLLLSHDGGFVTCGYSENAAVIYRSDCTGNLLAQIEKFYAPGPGRFYDSVQLPDGSVVTVGSAIIATPTDTLERVVLLKTSSDLTDIAAVNFPVLNKAARAKSVTSTSNGDLLILGEVAGAFVDFNDMFLQRVHPATLQPIGDPVIYNNGVDIAEEIIRAADGNYLLTGSSFFGNIFDPNAMIVNRLLAIKVNETGTALWQYVYQDTFPAQYGLALAGGAEQNPVSGNFMISGTTYGGSPEMNQDVFFMLLDNGGDLLDTALLQAPMRQGIYSMTTYADVPGLFLAVGDSDNPLLGTPNLLAAQAAELNNQIFQSALINEVTSPLALRDVIEIGQNRLAVVASIPDNPVAMNLKDIIVATPQIEDVEILYQNCALVASFNATDPAYQWYFNDAPVPGATTGVFFPTQSGVYQVQISDDIGCSGLSDTLTVTLVSAGFEVTNDNLTATFTNTSTGATTYLWSFGDGQTSTLDNPAHTYAAGGAYAVTLIAGSQCGSDTVVRTIGLVSAGEPSWLNHFRLFPNPNAGVFSLEINGEPQAELTVSLFNQVGQVVERQTPDFQTGNLQRTFDFGDLPPGVYTLQILAQGEAKYVKVAVAR